MRILSSSLIPPSAGGADGAALHAAVPPGRWCVTRQDIAEFARIVREAVSLGDIVPSEADEFDPKDTRGGPNVYTVTAQLIKPVTAQRGNMSWALMLHPDGLECDLFVTHGWQEGTYEFVNKVLHSWPHAARNAYCCMLSNPQNLDISSLINSPLSSPFAMALRSSKRVLVVPNDEVSIYSRIWCVYEAFLAHSWNKPISVATPPVPGLWRRVWSLILLCFVWIALTWFFFPAAAFRAQQTSYWHTVVYDVAFAAVTSLTLFLKPSGCLTALTALCSVAIGCVIGFELRMQVEGKNVMENHQYQPVQQAAVNLLMGIFFGLIGGDQLRVEQARRESRSLLRGFSGRLEDAEASIAADRENILAEIRAHDQEAAVEHSLSVLISAGMSTAELRKASLRHIDLTGAGKWSYGLAWAVFASFVLLPLADAVGGTSCAGDLSWVPWVRFGQGLVWLVLFAVAPPDRRGLTVAAGAKLGAFPHVLVWELMTDYKALLGEDVTHASCVPDLIGTAFWGPAMIIVSALGFGGFSVIPSIGRCFVPMLLSGNCCVSAPAATAPTSAVFARARSTMTSRTVRAARGLASETDGENLDDESYDDKGDPELGKAKADSLEHVPDRRAAATGDPPVLAVAV